MRLKQIVSFAAFVAVVAMSSGRATATPLFAWNGEWHGGTTLRCERDDIIGPGFCGAFGSGSLSQSGESALAHASYGASFRSDSGSATVEFSRDFTLNGSPDGWRVNMAVILLGSVRQDGLGAGGGLAANISVASVFSSGGVGAQLIGLTFGAQSPHNQTVDVSRTGATFALLADGSYRISGTLVASGSAMAGLGLGVGDLRVKLTAVPVPEVGSTPLIGIGLVALVRLSRRA